MRWSDRVDCVALVLTLGVAASALLAGCGGAADELPREAVSGTVKFQGEPLKGGMIQFQPASQAETTAGGAAVVDGRYAIPRSEGLGPGTYNVMISGLPAPAAATPAKPVMPGDIDPVPPPREPIPAKYNTKTQLTARVTKGGPNTFDFDLQPK
jgi:hypothetical protein